MEKDGQRLTLWGCAALWGSCDHPDEMERSLEGGMQREAEGSGEGSVAAWKVMLEPTESGFPHVSEREKLASGF